MERKLSILLSVLLMLGSLTACHSPAGQPEVPPGTSSSLLPPTPDVSGSQSAAASGQPAPDPEPEPEPALEFDPSYTLNIQPPEVSKGELELPVQGATGYASVQLPLWEEIPEPEPEPEEPSSPADPEPQPGAEPPLEQPPEQNESFPGDSDGGQAEDAPEQTADGDNSVQTPEDSSAPTDEPTPAPSSPFLPDFDQDAEGDTSHQPTIGPDGEIIYAPGEEPLPEPEPEPDIDPFEGAIAVLDPGTAFTVLDEEEGWWLVECGEGTGWIENRYCLINLPDVIPSMVYNATNSYDSLFVTSGKKIPNVTGRAFYPRGTYNRRLERNEFMMPVLYPMSKHICQAQQAALAQGNTLVLYEGYRPHEVQTTVYKALTALARDNPQVKEAVASAPWNISWFIAGGYSNHQRGFAMDVSLARIERAEVQTISGHQVVRVREYEEYTMPTPIHELSKAAATFVGPVASHSPTAWKSAKMTDTMAANKPALALQRYCTEAGLTPLASEWWHFNDLEARTLVLDNLSTGGYKISQCLSTAP